MMPEDTTRNTTQPAQGGILLSLYDIATGDDDARLCRDIPDAQCREQPKSFFLQILAQALSKTGDVLADPKVVLPWLLGMVGAPVFLIGLLVPVRESLSLLPQIIIGSIIRRFAVRKWFWVLGSLIEGSCIVAMGVAALLGLRGAMAGWVILGLLVIFSLARGIASIASKDTLGKTVSKGRRGRVSGYAATVSGIVAACVGLGLALSPEQARPDWLLYVILIAAGLAWFAAAAVFAGIAEHPGATEGGRSLGDLLRDQGRLLTGDRELQKFIGARALMISTALTGPVLVGLAQRGAGDGLSGLGWLVVASGVSSAVSAAFWGGLSDKSSRLTMSAAAALAGTLGFAVLTMLALAPDAAETIAFAAGALLIQGIAHSGVRIGRKTHVVDLAGGDRKAEYVALSNTIIGVLLLAMGGITGALIGFSLEVALGVLSVLALSGAALALTMEDAQGQDR